MTQTPPSALRTALAALALLSGLGGRPLAAQAAADSTSGTLNGTVVDQRSGQAVSDVNVVVQGTRVGTSTGADGRFALVLPAGSHTLVVTHLAYGEHTQVVVVAGGVRNNVQVRLSEQAIELEPLVVETLTDLDRRRRYQGTALNEIGRDEIQEASQRGLGLSDLLRQGMPSITVRGNCVEYRGARRGAGACREVHVVMDGVPVSSPSLLVATMPINDIERLEMLSPAEAGAIYGAFSGFGVLVIETRKGPTRERLRERGSLLPATDWSLETESYDWSEVMLSSFAGSALGVATGMLVGDRCLRVDTSDFAGLRTKCDPITTMAAGFFMLGAPGVTGGMSARWAGSTDRTRGRLVPSALLSTLTTATGYLIWVEGRTGRSQGAEIAGMSILFVGTPLITAFSDRFFRSLR